MAVMILQFLELLVVAVIMIILAFHKIMQLVLIMLEHIMNMVVAVV